MWVTWGIHPYLDLFQLPLDLLKFCKSGRVALSILQFLLEAGDLLLVLLLLAFEQRLVMHLQALELILVRGQHSLKTSLVVLAVLLMHLVQIVHVRQRQLVKLLQLGLVFICQLVHCSIVLQLQLGFPGRIGCPNSVLLLLCCRKICAECLQFLLNLTLSGRQLSLLLGNSVVQLALLLRSQCL